MAYETPTRAWARATADQSTKNGWDAWNIEFEGEMTPLRTLRNLVAEMDRHADMQLARSDEPALRQPGQQGRG